MYGSLCTSFSSVFIMSVSIYGGFESIISKLLSVSLSNKLESINSIFTLFKFIFLISEPSAAPNTPI